MKFASAWFGWTLIEIFHWLFLCCTFFEYAAWMVTVAFLLYHEVSPTF